MISSIYLFCFRYKKKNGKLPVFSLSKKKKIIIAFYRNKKKKTIFSLLYTLSPFAFTKKSKKIKIRQSTRIQQKKKTSRKIRTNFPLNSNRNNICPHCLTHFKKHARKYKNNNNNKKKTSCKKKFKLFPKKKKKNWEMKIL